MSAPPSKFSFSFHAQPLPLDMPRPGGGGCGGSDAKNRSVEFVFYTIYGVKKNACELLLVYVVHIPWIFFFKNHAF